SAQATFKLAEGAQKPKLVKEGPPATALYTFSVTANTDQATIQEYITDKIKPLFSSIQEISSVEVKGMSEKKLFIKVDPEKLKKENLTLDKVKQMLLANNISVPAGQLTLDDKSLNLQVGNKIQSVEDLKKVQLVAIDQDMSSLTDAFKSVGEGFGAIGSTVGKLGQGVGTLTGNQMLLQGQIQIMQGINGLSSLIIGDNVELKMAQANPTQTPESKSIIAGLEQKIQAEQAKITELQTKLAGLQAQVNASGTTMASQLKGLNGTSSSSSSLSSSSTAATVGLKIRTIPLSSLAEVSYEPEKNLVVTRLNGKPAILTDIKNLPGTNAVEVVKQVEAKLKGVVLPSGYQLTVLHDSSVQIVKSVHNMVKEALLGALFAMLVTFLFLRNWRSTIVAILSIPLSIFASLIVLKWLGYSLNIMTLAGMAVAVGRVVDDSIVVIENIYRRIRLSEERTSQLIIEATSEVGKAVTFSTITTIAVFGPLSFVPGIVGKFFVPFAVSVVIALVFSLLVAITVVPLLSRLFLLRMERHDYRENAMQKGYRSILVWSLEHKFVVSFIALLLVAGSLTLVTKIPQNFMPSEKAVSYGLKVISPIGTTFAKSNDLALRVEKELSSRPDIKYYQTHVSANTIDLKLELNDSVTQEDVKKFESDLRAFTDQLGPDIRSSLSPQGLTSGNGLVMVLSGADIKALKESGDMIVNAIKGVPGLADVKTNLSSVQPQISVQVKPEAAAQKGLYPAMVALSVREMISGDSVMSVNLDGRTTDVNLSLKVNEFNSLDAIRNQMVTSMTGEQVKIGDVATVSEQPGPTSMQRINQQEYVSVSGQFTTENSSGIQKDVEKRIAPLQLPSGVTYTFEGESKEIGEGFKNIAYAMAIAILLVYVVMLIGFGEMVAPFAILFSLPFIFVGGLWGLFLFKQALGMPAMVGFLMLIGIVVTNAIVFMDRAMQNRIEGLPIKQALVEAGVTRIRPILMTALATVGALLPLAISSEGGLVSRSLAIVVIAGLTTSTILTLVIVPVAYLVLDSLRVRLLGTNKVDSPLPK
ncbi:MAG TPA: acriflavin resistance protein, partial [Desulfosporosinus sp.]|nr:acriflavin resistance protein [Desulfosporosinus sp.]